MRIYLVRHGQTDWNLEERLQGQADNDLNASGIRQAERVARQLEGMDFDAAFCSPLVRSVHTARLILGDRALPLTADKRLMEIGFGDWEGEKITAVKGNPTHPVHDFFAHPDRYRPPRTAEGFEAVYRRTGSFIEQMLLPLEKRCRTVLIVGHGAVNRSIVYPLLGIPLREFWDRPVENCAATVLGLKDGRFFVDPRDGVEKIFRQI